MGRTGGKGKYGPGRATMTPTGRTAFRARWSSGLKIDILAFALSAPAAQ